MSRAFAGVNGVLSNLAPLSYDPLMYEGIDTVVLHNELACHGTMPLEWEPLAAAPDAFRLGGMEEGNLLLLQACVATEEHPVREKNEEMTPLASELARLDFKLNLVVQLLGSLVANRSAATPTAVRFNATGASWQLKGAVPPARGAKGIVKIQLRGSLPQTLNLFAEISAIGEREVSAKFLQMSEPVAELIQRLCFLQHRKQVAGARKSRNS